MYRIIQKVVLNPTVTKMVIEAPLIAQEGAAGSVYHHPPLCRQRTHSPDCRPGMTGRWAQWTSSSRLWAAPPWS